MRDHTYVHQYGEISGLRELRAKLNAKVGITEDDMAHPYSIYAQLCYGTHAADIVRKWLDSGILRSVVMEKFPISSCWVPPNDPRQFYILLGCAMSLGMMNKPDSLLHSLTDTIMSQAANFHRR